MSQYVPMAAASSRIALELSQQSAGVYGHTDTGQAMTHGISFCSSLSNFVQNYLTEIAWEIFQDTTMYIKIIANSFIFG